MNCGTCVWYERDNKYIPGGGNGICTTKRLSRSNVRTRDTNWCDKHKEREILVKEDSPESAWDDHGGEQCDGGDAGFVSTYEERVEMGRAQVVLRWDDDTQEIAVSVYLEGEAGVALHTVADLCGDRSRRTRPCLPTLGGTRNAPQELVNRDSVQSPKE